MPIYLGLIQVVLDAPDEKTAGESLEQQAAALTTKPFVVFVTLNPTQAVDPASTGGWTATEGG